MEALFNQALTLWCTDGLYVIIFRLYFEKKSVAEEEEEVVIKKKKVASRKSQMAHYPVEIRAPLCKCAALKLMEARGYRSVVNSVTLL